MDLLEIYTENREKVNITPFYASQEFSRKICDWNLVYITHIDHFIKYHLSPNRILAGGAVIDILKERTPHDYDIFFINKLPTKFIEKLKKKENYFESIHCIGIETDTKDPRDNTHSKIQFIKRLYDNPARVIGGFDLDACRFFMNHIGEIYATPTALFVLQTNKIVINPCCQSENFYFRMMKYQRKKRFTIIQPHNIINHHLFKNANDYNRPYYNNAERTLMMILANKAHKCIIFNKPITLSDLKITMSHFVVRWGSTNIISYVLPEMRGKKISEAIPFKVLNKILTEKYEEYKKLSNFLMSNTSSQMTASFHPTNYKLSEIYPGIKFDIFKNQLRACFAVIYFGRMPKVIYYKIFRDYFDSYIINSALLFKF